MRIWTEEWRRPQAVMWERNGWQREVALYVRALVVAEQPKATADSRRLVRQFMEGLGISGDGLRRNRWIIASAEEAPQRRPTPTSTKERLRVLDGTA